MVLHSYYAGIKLLNAQHEEVLHVNRLAEAQCCNQRIMISVSYLRIRALFFFRGCKLPGKP
jgi:hypothetical protein